MQIIIYREITTLKHSFIFDYILQFIISDLLLINDIETEMQLIDKIKF